jgi:hypothetical protein
MRKVPPGIQTMSEVPERSSTGSIRLISWCSIVATGVLRRYWQ